MWSTRATFDAANGSAIVDQRKFEHTLHSLLGAGRQATQVFGDTTFALVVISSRSIVGSSKLLTFCVPEGSSLMGRDGPATDNAEGSHTALYIALVKVIEPDSSFYLGFDFVVYPLAFLRGEAIFLVGCSLDLRLNRLNQADLLCCLTSMVVAVVWL